ncbi:MAG: DMT family transporter [Candidatus Bathyarchaeia archaeon]
MNLRGIPLIGYASTIAGISMMATVEVATKLIQGGVTPYQINFFRTLLGCIFLFLMTSAFGGGLRRFTGRNLSRILLMALAWNVLGLNLYFLAITWTSASHAALIFSANPVVASVLAVAILHEDLTLPRVIGALTGLLGVVAVITGFDPSFLGSGTLSGDLLMAIPLTLWCIYLVWGISWTSRGGGRGDPCLRDQLNYLCSTFTFGLVFLTPVFIWDASRNPVSLDVNTIGCLIYLGLATNGLAYILYFWGISMLEVSKGTMAFFLKPVIASILSHMILGEEISSPSFIIGAVLVSLGLLIASRSR